MDDNKYKKIYIISKEEKRRINKAEAIAYIVVLGFLAYTFVQLMKL